MRGNHLQPAASVAENGVTAPSHADVRECAQRLQDPVRAAHHEVAQCERIGTVARFEHERHGNRDTVAEHRANLQAAVGRFDGLHHFDRRDSRLSEALPVEVHLGLRASERCTHAYLRETGDVVQQVGHPGGSGVKHIQIRAEDADDQGRRVTGDRFIHALDQERVELRSDAGRTVQDLPNLVEYGLLFRAGQWIKLHLVFRVVTPVRIGPSLRAPCPLRHGPHALDLQHLPRESGTGADGFLQRGPRQPRRVNHVVTLAQLGQERAAEPGQKRHAEERATEGHRHGQAGNPAQQAQDPRVDRRDPPNERGHPVCAARGQQYPAKRRGQCERDHQGSKDREDVSQTQRGEHAARHAGDREQRHKHEHDDGACVHH